MIKKCKEKKKERKAEKEEEKEEEKEGVAGNEDNFVSVKIFRRKRSSFEKVREERQSEREVTLFQSIRNRQ